MGSVERGPQRFWHRIGFIADKFSTDQVGMDSLGMIQVHSIYCALYFSYYCISSLQISRHQIPGLGLQRGYLIHPSLPDLWLSRCPPVRWHQGLPFLGGGPRHQLSLILAASPHSSMTPGQCLYGSFPLFVCWGCLTRSCKWTEIKAVLPLKPAGKNPALCLLAVVGSSW